MNAKARRRAAPAWVARAFCLLALAAQATGCATEPRDAFTALDQAAAAVPGYGSARIWADAPPADIARMIASPRLHPTAGHEVNELALSGGGAGGSFAAGLLAGWSDTGRRPEFDIVTGVSTGALIAPFAFLGQRCDDALRDLYTGNDVSDLANPSLATLMSGSGLIDPRPLRDLIERYATPEMLSAIAAEHLRGRRLLVVTTNLDAQRPVLWDLGAVAASGRPDALALFRDVLMASASIPAVYPPVMIETQGPHGTLTEMHVDGGTSMQVYSLTDTLVAAARAGPGARSRLHLWVVVNNTLPPEFIQMRSAIVPVALRSFATLMKSQTRSIVTASFEAARRLGVDFNLAYIDRAVAYDATDPFARAYRTKVYELGRDEARAGTVWRKSPDHLSDIAQR